MTRTYRQEARARSAADTRQRIVDATVQLHGEQGIAATSYRDVATRAGVGIGTVYNHFPAPEDLIAACGGHLWATTLPPRPEDLASLPEDERLEGLVSAVFAWYERYPTWRRGLCDADALAAVAAGVARREARLIDLVRAATGTADGTSTAVVRALVDFEVYRSLTRSGLSLEEAILEISHVLTLQRSGA